MTETLGTFTVDAAEGILQPAYGIIKTSIDPAPPTYYAGQAVGVESTITTVRTFATTTAALAEALAYAAAIGSQVVFRGVACFVANVEPDHRAAEIEGDPACATAVWTLVASPSWVP